MDTIKQELTVMMECSRRLGREDLATEIELLMRNTVDDLGWQELSNIQKAAMLVLHTENATVATQRWAAHMASHLILSGS